MDTDTGVNSGEVVSSAADTDIDDDTSLETEGASGALKEGDAAVAKPQEGEDHIQTPEQRAKWAEMRREAEAAKKELARRDKWVTDNFGQHGLTTWAQYEVAVTQNIKKEQEAQRKQLEEYHSRTEKQLQEAGYDTRQIREFFRTDPVFIQMQQENDALKQYVAKSEREKQTDIIAHGILADHAKLREKYGDMVPDLGNLDEDTVRYCRQGMTLRAAWLLANEDKILANAKTKATQKTIRDVNSKSHLNTEKSGAGGMGTNIEVSDEQMKVWKQMFPGETEAQLKKRIAKYPKKAAK